MDDAYPTFTDVIREALATVKQATGADVEALFGERVIDDWLPLSRAVERAIGFLEGAACALDVTVLELLDSLHLE